MERTVPRTATEEVDLYVRTIYSLLRSTAEVQIRTLEEVHAGMNSLLHPEARSSVPDTSAFIYSLLRLPDCMPKVRLVVLGQSTDLFIRSGYAPEEWQSVSARARRRRWYYDGDETLAAYIASRSDIDDVIPIMVAYQIEWNKLNLLLRSTQPETIIAAGDGDLGAMDQLSTQLEMPVDDIIRFRAIWRDQFAPNLMDIAHRRRNLAVRLLGGSLSQYWRATRAWWENIERKSPAVLERPIYFVSSNSHSIANLLSGFARLQEQDLVFHLERNQNADLVKEWEKINQGATVSSRDNFLYYLLKRFQDREGTDTTGLSQEQHDQSIGITRIPSKHYFDLDAQVIELRKLDPALFDPRLLNEDFSYLKKSDALILNIDYPLGLAAYNVLAKVAEYANPIMGVYIMGKSASLNARIGDVVIPNVVHDEHSQNTYLFQNTFTAQSVSPYLTFGTVLDNQKAVSVLGTFLQTKNYATIFFTENFVDIEMESGSFLSAMYEMYRPQRHPKNEIVNLYPAPFDIGILHYVSDTPMSKGRNLGAGTLSYFGMDSTYATSIAILRRILALECRRQRASCLDSPGDHSQEFFTP
ncbi:MAG: hypothetical protein PHQ40_08160 [Anaerolineaceae bacterium]|nr:hypothetical protein [Anaerolineaceae bacterium]